MFPNEPRVCSVPPGVIHSCYEANFLREDISSEILNLESILLFVLPYGAVTLLLNLL